ncbi:MAG TPA: hypothetical protein P5052_02100 [Candidatus Paceibacterota bacterium]|nr:hypothetical protein [Candidatus Paceibacterota bacterium]HRZ29543.1 hypothetical protein [Candidatus Paceibacterota bacterium]
MSNPKRFASFQASMVNYERHQDHVIASFSQFLVRYPLLPLNVGSIILGYPEPGVLPKKPNNLISIYTINPGTVSDIERKVVESVITKKVLEPFKKELLQEGPFKGRQDIVDAIVLSQCEER